MMPVSGFRADAMLSCVGGVVCELHLLSAGADAMGVGERGKQREVLGLL